MHTPWEQRYQIVEPLRTGGMATIYLAWDRALQRRVALKRLKPALRDDAAAVQALRAEAQTLARLRHSHIIAIYDAQLDADPPFLVTELLEGQPLSALVPLPPMQATDYALQVVTALAYSHAHSVIHCDVKPDNIMVDATGHVKLLDFGISAPGGMGQDGDILGSPHYVAPERVLGRPLTPAADIYSMGIVIFQMITGVVPFHGPDAASIARQHVEERVPLMSEVILSVPLALERVVAKCTAPSPLARYPHGAALVEALIDCRYELAGLRPPPRANEPLPIDSPERLWEIPTTQIPALPASHPS
ncbi:serine/threonine-protein kinase [Kallotenue papyrolyticum]|uniref:serine/threonine-protein kinase n=1 Tax=Kallotenue papyrolyticum TaxID=1325125 RepID=UPI0004785A7E|nr:serine/threonine-protein kinase [Kallotenue papyrolyticum]